MWRYTLQTLHHQWKRQVFASGGFFIVACALILLNVTTQTIAFQGKQIIGQNWRSTYDLVVLPSHSSLPSQQNVPPDHLIDFQNGISIQQYQQIKNLPGVAVAAPLSFIGNADFPIPYINFGNGHLAPGFYTLHWTLTAFDGLHDQTDYQQSTTIYGADTPCDKNGNCAALSDETLNALEQLGVTTTFSVHDDGTYFTGVPHPGTFLLAAIDPQSEDQLVHLNSSITQGGPLPQQSQLQTDAQVPTVTGSNIADVYPNYDVPILINQQLPGQISMHAIFTRLRTTTNDPTRLLNSMGTQALQQVSAQQVIFNGNVPIPQNNIRMFTAGTSLQQKGNQFVIQDYGQPDFNLNLVSSPSNINYQPSSQKAPDGSKGYRVQPVPMNTDNAQEYQGNGLAVRPFQPLPGPVYQSTINIGSVNSGYSTNDYTIYNNAAYRLIPTGQFDGYKLSASFNDILNWLPENTYTPNSAILRYNAQGQPVKAVTLQPTTNPQGFTLQSPLALTTLTAAQRILGNNCINVIRIRVAGNITPNQQGWEQVARIAQQIHKRTGLTALVTLGSSPRPTLVYVSGVSAGQLDYTQSVAPLGWVEERWVALGVGILYLHQLGTTQSLLLAGVLLVSFGYLVVTLTSLVAGQRRQFAILSALGWRPWHPALSFLLQTCLLALGGGSAGLLFALLVVFLIGAAFPWTIILWTLPAILLLASISILYPLSTLWRVKPAEILRVGTVVTADRQSRLNTLLQRLPSSVSMALRNLARARWRALILLASLFCSTLLLILTLAGILALRQTLQGTLLGNFVLLQTAVPQICGAFFTILLAILSLADLLVIQVHERQQEIGVLQALGWRPRMVQNLFLQEALLLVLLGTMPGIIAGFLVLMAQKQYLAPTTAWLIAASVVVLMLCAMIVAILPALRTINRLSLQHILRAE